jgi:type VI secretion system protein ImpH
MKRLARMMQDKDVSGVDGVDVGGSVRTLPAIDAVRYSFFQAMRDIEIANDDLPRLGHALSPSREPVRVKQSAELGFAPHTVSKIERKESGPTELEQRFIGLIGPGGPFPLHLSELVRNRARHAGDEALQSFLDLFHHRIAMLFYRAWSSSRAIIQSDRPDDDRWQSYLGSLVGIGYRTGWNRDALSDSSKIFFSGHLAGLRRNREGLESIIQGVLKVKTQVQPFALRWLPLPIRERSRLRHNNQLGRSSVLGERVPDRQSNIEIKLGPVDHGKFSQFLPGSDVRNILRDLVSGHSGLAMDARVTVSLQRQESDAVSLGKVGQLGRTAWIGGGERASVRDDYSFDLHAVKNESQTKQEPLSSVRKAA